MTAVETRNFEILIHFRPHYVVVEFYFWVVLGFGLLRSREADNLKFIRMSKCSVRLHKRIVSLCRVGFQVNFEHQCRRCILPLVFIMVSSP